MELLLWLLVIVSVVFLIRNILKSDTGGIVAQAISCYLILTLMEYLKTGNGNLYGLIILLLCSIVSITIHKDIRREKAKNEVN